MGEAICRKLSTRKAYTQVGVVLAEIFEQADSEAIRFLAGLEDENPDGELSPMLKAWAIVTELLFGPAAYRTVLYATTRRRAQSTNFDSVYKALLSVYRGNPFPDAKVELPKLYQWAVGRSVKPKGSQPKPKKTTPKGIWPEHCIHA